MCFFSGCLIFFRFERKKAISIKIYWNNLEPPWKNTILHGCGLFILSWYFAIHSTMSELGLQRNRITWKLTGPDIRANLILCISLSISLKLEGQEPGYLVTEYSDAILYWEIGLYMLNRISNAYLPWWLHGNQQQRQKYFFSQYNQNDQSDENYFGLEFWNS